ncbi:MAG TPA: arginine deiminase family protein [Pyrinomonadaceae bacterium]|nr:arginine deiminase family protein [Pyrinomonadaceae bacterium]
MLRALTHEVSPRIAECQLTFIERSPIDLQLAVGQHDDYCTVLKGLGVIVKELYENESYPDSCFVEDTAIVVDELAIICSMGVSSRRGETMLIERELSRYREIAHISLPATIEGGDVLRIGKKIFIGQSTRTNLEGVEELARILEPCGYRIVHVRTKGSLHLKSACTAIDEETLFVNPEWVELDAFRGFNLIYTPAEEPWSANVLRVGTTVCIQAGFPGAVELIERVVDRVEIIDMSELRKAEAGLTCSSIVFESAA